MLLSFRFANHRSFADEQQLNLTPVYASDREPSGSRPAVSVVGIFGANASGKSNALSAFAFMRHAVLNSDREVEPGYPGALQREPFLLDEEIEGTPSRFVADLLLEGVRHTYGFSVDGEKIVEEWLYFYPLKKKRRIFERDGDDFKWGDETRKDTDLERIAGITAPAALFLSTVARFNKRAADDEEPEPLHDVYRWFRQGRARHRPVRRTQHLGALWHHLDAGLRESVTELLRVADVGIVDVAVEEEPISRDSAEAGLAEWVTRAKPQRRLVFAHRGPSGKGFLSLDEESTGTQQLMDLAIESALVLKSGGLMIVDEIDASLHPVLTAKLIGLFRSPVTNQRRSQLVFTSHDATLLGTLDTEEILARDEIWFAEKDQDGTSTLYPLTDFKPRRDENRQRRYLNGNYGGIPQLSMELFERALATRTVSADDTET